MSSTAANQVVLITGGNRGLGLEAARALLKGSQQRTVLLTGRSLERTQAAASELVATDGIDPANLIAKQLDVEDQTSIKALAEEVEAEFGKVDVVVNNAGASFDMLVLKGEMTELEAWTKSWSLNVMGSHFVTSAFAPLLLKSSAPRVVFVTSGTGSLSNDMTLSSQFNKPPPAGWPKQDAFPIPAYRSSKAGMNMMARNWVRVFANDGVQVSLVCPGRMATDFGGMPAARKAEMGIEDASRSGELIRKIVDGERDEHLGQVTSHEGVIPW